jgi:hypothetical protein
VFALSEVQNVLTRADKYDIPEALEEKSFHNVFHDNAEACSFAACLLQAAHVDQRATGKRIVEVAVPIYLSFMTSATERLADPLRQVLRWELGGAEAKQKAFSALVGALRGTLGEAPQSELTAGIQRLIDGVLVLRDKRVEETPLTLDIRLPVNASWEVLVLEASSSPGEGPLQGEKLSDKQGLLRDLPRYSSEDLIDELEEVGRQLGRGVARMALREGTPPTGKGLLRCEQLYESHENAPFSRLYGLDWQLPQLPEKPDVRLLLLPNSTVSIHVHDDPLFEYMLGTWRYVGIAAKMQSITQFVDPDADDAFFAGVFRIARMAHHLAYHNHGAILDVNFASPPRSANALPRIKDRWDLAAASERVSDAGLQLSAVRKEGEVPKGAGRLAYTLCIQDGASSWHLGEQGTLHLVDFGEIMKLNDGQATARWTKICKEMGVPSKKIGGARHRAAFLRSLDPARENIVFCVSQDGYIDLYFKGRFIRIR